jgi:diguanylate cyclase (GGDEF)-like protein
MTAEEQRSRRSGSADREDGPAPRRSLVMVVDDQPMNIQLLHRILRAEYEVCMATNGPQALALCEARSPDVILLDVVMPGMGGYEVARRLKSCARTAEIPIIFVTAQNDPDEEAQALDEGAADFISKPFHEKVVKARIRTQLTLKRLTDQLRSLALIDGLTGIGNRRQFDQSLVLHWAQCLRTGVSLALIMIDIDFFKRYNDTYGHQAGDACIQAVAATLRANCRRPQDLVARCGGEEFACLLPDTPLEGAHQKALELEGAIRSLGIVHENSDVAGIVTVSLGVAAAMPIPGADPDKLIGLADRMLYAAKQAGRGQVKCADPIPVGSGPVLSA